MAISDSAYIRRFFSLYSQEEKDKVRGHAFYPTDYLSALLPAGVAYVGVVRSPFGGATFSKIDKEAASKIPGVLKIITAGDVPKNLSFGSSKGTSSQLILGEHSVRYKGEPVALIVAENPDALEVAKVTLQIDWTEAPLPEAEIVQTLKHQVGHAFKETYETIETPFKFPSLQSRYLEAESGWVDFRKQDEQLVFHIGSLLSESQRLWLSQVLGVPHSSILAKESPLGGVFGGRQQRELIVFLALAAHLTKRSVCLHFAQQEQDIGSYGYEGNLKLTFDPATQRLKSLTGRVRVDAGSYEGNAAMILQKTLEHAASLYDFKHIDLEGEIVLTPTHPRRALKGEGLTAITWVTEQLVERAAKALEVSPLEFRMANCRTEAETSAKVLQEVEKLERPFRLVPIDRNRPIWDEKEIVGRGFGFQVFQPTTLKEFDHSEITIELQNAGTFLIRTANLTLDLHAKSALCEVAAAVLKTHPKAFTVEGKMRLDFEKPARRETYPEFYYLAQATWSAASLLKDKLLKSAKKVFGTDDAVLKDGAICDSTQNRKMGYRELAFTHPTEELSASFILKDVDRPHGCSAGATSRVSFHPLTGEMRVESVKVVLDAGPVLYRKGLEIQVDTAVSWAMAALFSSELADEQPIPTPLDGPEETSLFALEYAVKDLAEKAPEYFGSRGITDVLMSAVLASLVNAIHDAKAVPLEEIPMSLEFMYPKRKYPAVHTLQFKR